MNYIKSINWIFTYKCNLKCNHCDIWSNPYKNELDLEHIRKIITSKTIQDSYTHYGDLFDIAISGGEPLLIENLKDIICEIDTHLPGSIHSISTNGIFKKQIIELLVFLEKKERRLRKINISIDGNEKNHDLQRGIPGSFKRSIETIQTIKKLFPSQIIELKLTITKNNYKDILFVSKLASKLGVFFSFKPVENMKNYTNKNGDINTHFEKEEIDEIEKQIINNPYIIEQDFYIQKEFFYTIPSYLKSGLGEAKKICTVADNSLTIMPDGKIFSCILMDMIGDIKKDSLEDIWGGLGIGEQRKIIKEGKCPECMLMCGSFKSKEIYAK